MASAGEDDMLRLWDVQTGRLLWEVVASYDGVVESIAFSPNDSDLAIATTEGAVQLRDTVTGEITDPVYFERGKAAIRVAFSYPDGRYLAASFSLHTKIFDLDAPLAPFVQRSGHGDEITAVTFSQNGRYLASGSRDGIARVWEAPDWRPVGDQLNTGAVVALGFRDDSAQLYVASANATLNAWPLSASREVLCHKLSSDVNQRQWREWIADDPIVNYRRLCPEHSIDQD